MIGSIVKFIGQPEAPEMTVVGQRPNGDYRCIWYTAHNDTFQEIYADKDSLIEVS